MLPAMTVKKRKILVDGKLHYSAEPYKADEKEQLIHWLATPQSERTVYTYTDLAAQLGVTTVTIRAWRQDPEVIARVKELTHGAVGVEKIPVLVENLFAIATDPGTNPTARIQASKALLDWHEKSSPRDRSHAPLGELSLKDLRTLAAELYDTVDERLPKVVGDDAS